MSLSLFGLTLLPAALGGGIESTRHNLSVTGPGSVKSTTEDEICVFCHAGHVEGGADGPLWNHETSAVVAYQPYESPTLGSRGRQPDGASRLCLSCHDGTIAVGAIKNRPTPLDLRGVGPGGRLQASASGNLGRDLSGSHPVSMPYADAQQRFATPGVATWLKPEPDTLRELPLLDAGGKVQCTACHDPHVDPAAEGVPVPPFWRGDSVAEVCAACHVAPIVQRGHDDPSLLPQGCESCHVGHGVSRQPLLPAGEEEACYTCHGSESDRREMEERGLLSRSARPARIDDLFERPYRHPVGETYGEHDPTEDMLGAGAGIRRHVECADCHDMHGAGGNSRRIGVAPIGSRARFTETGEPEYELCYECHSTNANLPYGETDKSAEFDSSNRSFHPVETPLVEGSSPSLLSPWLHGDVMGCSDCHGADGDDERQGPHGSRNRWILRGSYVVTDGTPESEGTYEACYECHSRSVILSGSTFEGHPDHVLGADVSCYSCHDSHGSAQFPGLVRFNKDLRHGIVRPSSSGRLEYSPAGGGTCYLTCHDVDHNPAGYP